MGDLITTQELRGIPPTDAKVINLKQGYLDEIEQRIKTYEQIAKPMPEPVKAFTEDMKRAFEQEFSRMGIKEIKWPKVILTDTDLSHAGGDSPIGFTIPNLVVVSERLGQDSFAGVLAKNNPKDHPMSADSIRNISFIGACQTLAHELFHSTAPAVVAERYHKAGKLEKFLGKKDKHIIGIDRQGLHFSKSLRHQSGTAVEEGLAMLAQDRMKTVLEKHFPKEWATLRHDAEVAIASDPDANIPIESFSVATDVPFGCPDSTNLVKELIDTVPDFERLAARARMLHETLPLARAIESVYGPKSYSKIMSTSEETAGKVLKEMQKIHPIPQAMPASRSV